MVNLTTEEAIKELSRYTNPEFYTPQNREAHRMAIEALELNYVYGGLRGYGKNLTICGYRAEHLAVVATMLKEKLITEDKLAEVFNDFEAMYSIACNAHHLEVKQAINSFVYESVYPSVGEVAAKMWPLPDSPGKDGAV